MTRVERFPKILCDREYVEEIAQEYISAGALSSIITEEGSNYVLETTEHGPPVDAVAETAAMGAATGVAAVGAAAGAVFAARERRTAEGDPTLAATLKSDGGLLRLSAITDPMPISE